MVFGILITTFFHGVVEMTYVIKFLLKDFDKYSFGLSWEQLFLFHKISAVTLFLVGAIGGVKAGIFFWPRLYDENGHVRKNLRFHKIFKK